MAQPQRHDPDDAQPEGAGQRPEAESGSPSGSRMSHFWWYWTHRHRENWWQLMKFSIVGGSGYVVNLVVYSLSLAALHYHAAAVLAFGVANVNNYIWNRYWSFPRQEHSVLLEYARFLAVGLAALAINLLLLGFFVETLEMGKIWAQALAVVLVTPIGFVGNKLFTFRARTADTAKRPEA